MDRRFDIRERLLEQDAALALRLAAQVPAPDCNQVERDEGRRRRFRQLGAARGCRVKPKLQRVEIEPVGRRDHDLAVDDTAVRQIGKTGRVELGKVAIERPQVPALNEYLGSATKYDRPKSIPLGLI